MKVFPRLIYLLISACLFLSISTMAQYLPNDTTELKPKKYYLRGYIKNLVSININKDSTTLDNLVHNRLNFKWYPNDNFSGYLEVRNRLFSGNLVKSIPEYGEFVDVGNDYFDLSLQGPGNKSWLFQTMIDRAFIEWYNEDWELRLGRQRINWGVNLVWNPNDLFNAYSFFDFDYEERPGSDAIRLKRYTGFASSFELAASINDDFDEMVIAGMWKFNKWGYDFQFLTGKVREDIVLGMGWAGNLGTASLKGEITWFSPYTDEHVLSKAFLSSISVDYSFENALYLHGSVLYNSKGSDDNTSGGLNLGQLEPLTARSLSPFTYSTFLQVTYTIHPLINGSVSTIYYPGKRNGLFVNPSVSFSIKPNLDLDLIGQVYYDKSLTNGSYSDYQNRVNLIYVRVKWSF